MRKPLEKWQRVTLNWVQFWCSVMSTRLQSHTNQLKAIICEQNLELAKLIPTTENTFTHKLAVTRSEAVAQEVHTKKQISYNSTRYEW